MHFSASSTRGSFRQHLPEWIQEGYIRDDVARDHEMRHPGSLCLQTRVPATVGMMTHTEIRTTSHTTMLLVGKVIWIGDLPSAGLSQSGSLYWKLGKLAGLEKEPQIVAFIYKFLGSLHGQRAVGLSSFVDQTGKNATAVIAYVFDDNMLLPWTVEGFYVVNDEGPDRQVAILGAVSRAIGGPR